MTSSVVAAIALSFLFTLVAGFPDGLDRPSALHRQKRALCGLSSVEVEFAERDYCDQLPRLTMEYGHKSVQCGVEKTKEQTANVPTAVTFNHVESDGRYTLVMVDPQGATPYGPGRYWLHWVIANIPGSALIDGHTRGETLMAYNGPTPPKGTGKHHYEFYLFQEAPQANVELERPDMRAMFSLADFVENNNLCSIEAKFLYVVIG